MPTIYATHCVSTRNKTMNKMLIFSFSMELNLTFNLKFNMGEHKLIYILKRNHAVCLKDPF